MLQYAPQISGEIHLQLQFIADRQVCMARLAAEGGVP